MTIKEKLIEKINALEKQEKLLNEAYNYLSYLESQEEDNVFRAASEQSLKKVWDNTEDDIYNQFVR
ncbi:hypothetical protein [Marivirga sp.]|uniref:hypothetical protein n=1 Tax=Marivirga sp. TaxID=2018662 RepID=UPI002D7EAF91|nr:hypothetical protein [Marivirga sp.]HET8861510.1 hypothetical protein [Marivirga sp.]